MRRPLVVMVAVLIVLASASTLLGSRPLSVHASSSPFATFDWTPCETCVVVGDLFFFNANGSLSPSGAIVSYTWNFGDGTIVKTANPIINHDYPVGVPSKGVNVTLTVQDITGQTGTIRQLIMFQTVPAFSFTPTFPAVGVQVKFDGSGSISFSNLNPILGYLWDFGDGSSGSGVIVTHSYTAPGSYRVGLSLVTPDGRPTTSRILVVGNIVLKGTFDDVNVTVTGSFSLNQTSRTLKATLTVTVVNATSGLLIITKTLNLTVMFGSRGSVVFVLELPTNSYTLGIGCSANLTGAKGCILSKSPDLNHNGTIDIIDVSMMASAFDSTPGTPKWNPNADLNNNGIVDIVDLSIAAFDFGAPVFS
ncbi:PKD domain-containing protein [Candidatus Bathyarchaeota archaeon]|nr:MAG: PKD domain-containing protein [Candidatus Bathyarchaeota archaeon]